jgi:hypothetical protein
MAIHSRWRLRAGQAGVRFPAAKSFRASDNEAMAMTEQEWLACSDPEPMLAFLRGKVSDRKLRLLACACCRYLSEQPSEEDRETADLGERFADGLVTSRERQDAYEALQQLKEQAVSRHEFERAAWLLRTQGCVWPAYVGWCPSSHGDDQSRSKMLRHIMGNPFRPYPAPQSWPSTVVQLAESLYAGQDCAFALHDALLEAGHAELAEHFREEKSHPKGCWAMDVVLGKS